MAMPSKKRIVEILTPPANDTLLDRDENNVVSGRRPSFPQMGYKQV